MKNKHTTVDWIQGMIYFECNMVPNKGEIKISLQRIEELFQQAKQMERSQINDAYKQGKFWGSINGDSDAEQYYNETFNQNNK